MVTQHYWYQYYFPMKQNEKNIVFLADNMNKKKSGQSTLELIIALAIIAMTMSAIIALFFGGQSLLVDTRNAHEGGYRARQALEEARSLARTDFSALQSTSTTIDGYTIETIVEPIGVTIKKVTSRTSWQTDPIRVQTLELVAYLTDWRNVLPPIDPDDSGGGGLLGDWKNPQTLLSITITPGGNQATDVDVIGSYAYVTSEHSSSGSSDFWIIDVSSPTTTKPNRVMSSLNTGPGLQAIDATAGHAFVANLDTTRQLQIINIANPAAPFLIASSTMPGVSGPNAKGVSVFYAPPYVLVGLGQATGPELHVVDVGILGTFSNPVHVGSLEIGSAVNKIITSQDKTKAYLATSDQNEELKIISLVNPSAPQKVEGFNMAGTSPANTIYHMNDVLYVGRSSPASTLSAFQISGNTLSFMGDLNMGGAVNDIAIRDCLAFSGTNNSNKEFQISYIANPSAITDWSSFNFPQVQTGVDYENNFVYSSARSNDALRIITSSSSSTSPCQ